jgi:hypothetical protein
LLVAELTESASPSVQLLLNLPAGSAGNLTTKTSDHHNLITNSQNTKKNDHLEAVSKLIFHGLSANIAIAQ